MYRIGMILFTTGLPLFTYVAAVALTGESGTRALVDGLRLIFPGGIAAGIVGLILIALLGNMIFRALVRLGNLLRSMLDGGIDDRDV